MSVTQQRLVSFDLVTGHATPVGSVGGVIQNIAYRPATGYLYGYDVATTQALMQISPVDGASSPIGPRITNFGWQDVQGFAYSAVQNEFFATLTATNELLRVNPDTGVPTLVGVMPDRSWALASDPDSGTLYGVSIFTQGLISIDTNDGSITAIGNGMPVGPVEGLAFNQEDGLLYAVVIGIPFQYSTLVTIDPATADMTPIGVIGTDDFISGLAFVPEPGNLAALGLAGALLRRRRR
jgi:hypothetical protein